MHLSLNGQILRIVIFWSIVNHTKNRETCNQLASQSLVFSTYMLNMRRCHQIWSCLNEVRLYHHFKTKSN